MQTRNISAGFSVAENQVKLPFSFPHFDESRQDEIEMQICSLIVLKKKIQSKTNTETASRNRWSVKSYGNLSCCGVKKIY